MIVFSLCGHFVQVILLVGEVVRKAVLNYTLMSKRVVGMVSLEFDFFFFLYWL